MPQIQLKFILPFAAFSETIDLPLSSTISDLKSLIWEYFQLPIEKQLLRLRNKDLDIRITDSFPLNFYDLDSQALILVESLDNFKERMLFKGKRMPFTRKRRLPDAYETLKIKGFLTNLLNRLIEVYI